MSDGSPDVHVLAELDADIAAGLAPDPGAAADPASRAVLDALAATRAELAALSDLPVPPEYAARWTAALTPARVDGTSTPSSPIRHTADRPPTGGAGTGEDRRFGARVATSGRERTDPVITPRSRPAGRDPAGASRRRRRVRPAVAVGLAIVGLLVVVGVVAPRPGRPAITASELGGVAGAAVGAHDAGELNDPVRRRGCLRSVARPGLDPGAPLLGGRGVVLDGRPGILLVLATGRRGGFRVVVVDPACGPDGGTVLGDTLIGR